MWLWQWWHASDVVAKVVVLPSKIYVLLHLLEINKKVYNLFVCLFVSRVHGGVMQEIPIGHGIPSIKSLAGAYLEVRDCFLKIVCMLSMNYVCTTR